MSDLAQRLAALSPEQREALMQRMKDRGALPQPSQASSKNGDAGTIAVVPRGGDLPLSFGQQRLWVLDQLDSGRAVYNVYFPSRLSGPLDVDLLEQSINTIVQRHESLRTVFTMIAEQPAQVILSSLHIPLPVTDLRHLPEHVRESEAQRLLAEEVQRPFDLAHGPLLRTALLRLGTQEYVLILCMHHIVNDEWSIGVLYQELGALYSAALKGQPANLPRLPIQYADFAVWQRQRLQGALLERQLAYWKSHLADARPLDLPTDRPRPPLQTFDGAPLALALSTELTAALHRLSQREGGTLFMTLLAAFEVLLARYSGQTDFCVGTPIANRTQRQIEPLIGPFLNTLVLASDVAGNPTFRELLGRVRETALAAYDHQDLPFEMLVEALQPAHDLSRSALFQVMFVLQNVNAIDLKLPGLRAEPFQTTTATAKFDLTWTFWEDANGLAGEVIYNTNLFDAATIERMAGHFVQLLETLAAQPDLPVMQVPLATALEQQRLLHTALPSSYQAPAQPLHVQFEAQVERAPFAIALTYEGQRLTYRELNQQANRLAHHLRSLGVGPETLVGLFLQRSPDLIVALLAILKAGGAYLPIDPAYPADRIAFMLDDAHVSVLLTATTDERPPTTDERPTTNDQRQSAHPLTRSPAHPLTRSVDLIADWPTIAQQPDTNPQSGVSADNLAYVIYTSGSTGKPKGALITHAHVSRLFSATQHWFEFGEHDVWTLFHSTAFDFSVWEIWGALLYGGRLVVVPYLLSRSPEAFAALLADEQVTVLNQTPSAFRQLSAAVLASAPVELALRYIIFGGEALDLESLRPWMERYGEERPRLVNMYGITETTVHVTYRPLGIADVEAATGSVIGVPIPDLQVYVLDQYRQPVPVGVVGEMYVGGAGVARGYLNRPELTEERFIPNPFPTLNDKRQTLNDEAATSAFSVQPLALGERLYKTGDLARLLGRGELQYLGRADQQVKIRGFRIELGEIEAVLEQHHAVREALVLPRESVPGDQRLVAYIVPTTDHRPPTNDQRGQGDKEAEQSPISEMPSSILGELRTFLRQRLPEYMVPAAFVLMRALPLTSNGKIDCAALPAPSGAVERADSAAPRTPVEELLADIWADILQVERVGIHDNFFEHGGHSLLGTRLMARVRATFGVELPLRALFEEPTVAKLAEQIDQAQRSAAPAPPPIQPVPRDATLPLSFAQERLWFLDQFQPDSSVYNTSVAWRVAGPLDLASLKRSLETITQRHEALRTAFAVEAGRPVQLIGLESSVPLPVVDLRHMPADVRMREAMRQVGLEEQHPFQLDRGPLLRALVLRLGDDDSIVLLVVHHIVFDAWSFAVFYQELAACYAAYRAGRMPQLPELAVQYADFAVWQRQHLQGEALAHLLGYWKQRLAGVPELALPTDHPRPAVQTLNGALEQVNLSPELAAALTELSRREGVTLFMLLLAAWQTLLARYSGQNDIAVGVPIAGRTHTAIERLIGFFVNMLVLRGDLSGNPTFRGLLQQIRDLALGAYAHQDLPFEWLVEELQPDRDMSRPPLVQVVFSFQNTPEDVLALDNLSLSPFVLDHDTAKFDLTLIMQEQQGQLQALLEYNVDLFERGTIQRMLDHLCTMLEAIVTNPERRLADLPLLTARERQVLLVDWNATATAYPRDATIHSLFERQVERRPEAAAVVFDDVSLTYRALNERANRLAHYLKALGVGPEVPVGICLERSFDLIIAILGVLKAGGVYVPLDPGYPAERLAWMSADTRMPLVVTRESAGDHAWLQDQQPDVERAAAEPPLVSPRAVLLDRDAALIAAQPGRNPDSAAGVDNLVYLMYTSGSTGRPKGIGIPHRAITRVVRNTNYIQIADADRIGHLSNVSFDAATFEIWGALLNGATLIGIPREIVISVYDLAEQLNRQQITALFLTTALFNQVVRAVPDAFQSVSSVLFGGEAADPSAVRRLLAHNGPRRLLNVYGPTESTTFASWHLVEALPTQATTVPIGRALANTQTYVLDRTMRPVPVGVPGELYIGGDGLARGYLNRPELTAEKFVPNPFPTLNDKRQTLNDESASSAFSVQPLALGERLYRTGDLVRYREDGALMFVGRIDRQIKLRGFRIELGEIEALLEQHPGVDSCLVLVREDVPGDKRLVGYVVPANDQRPTTNDQRGQGGKGTEQSTISNLQSTISEMPSSFLEDLRAFLKQRLPEYMLPSAFVVLDAWPLTPNGKVDRAALPAPDLAHVGVSAAGFVGPRTALEGLLVALWSDVLGLPKLGVYDNFFALGGHSLLATQLISQVRNTFQVQVPIRALFEAPTVAEFAGALTAAEAKPGQVERIAQFLRRMRETASVE